MIVRLGLDASLRIPSCAVSVNGTITLATTVDNSVEGYSNVIREAMRKAQLQLTDVDEIVACVGPGSYIGVQTTVATANALAMAIGRPMTSVLSVDAVAVGAPASKGEVAVAVPAGRGRWFVAAYYWSEGILQRDNLPELVDDVGQGVLRACQPDCDASDGVPLSAERVLIVAEQQRHLALATCRSEVAPHLPPANVRGSK